MVAEIDILPVPFRVEAHETFEGGVLEIRRYFWSAPVEATFQSLEDALVLNMALTSRPARTKVGRFPASNSRRSGDAGRLLVMMPRAPYHITAPSGAFRSLHCALDCEWFERVCGEPIDWSSLSELGGELRPRTRIEPVLARMHDELVHRRFGGITVISACATTLCIELFRLFRRGEPIRPDVYAGGLAAWRMRVIAERLHADTAAPNVGELATLCGLTTRQLSRAFKAETGITIGRYVEQVTIERAHRLLTSTSRTIAEIARELGFASADSFAQFYRRTSGSPPSHARRPPK